MTIAEILTLVGDNPKRIHSEAALAKLCGACVTPASTEAEENFYAQRDVPAMAE